ncbi:sulfurtransferase [Porticoccus sp. W117]|uniref:sulfurtransferase n=1 Tax=Porticoccus sp. W117 TaxID=3054777 RepID=UPI002594A063|nr:sulfurtransferase [Porticoccus sp. W117]MDM3871142.1 sulfurtransferase [Porticoccus sp. W117]
MTAAPVISIEEFQRHSDSNWIVFDCRFNLADTEEGQLAYNDGHIPSSHYLHLDNHLSGAKAKHGGRHPLPSPEQFATTMTGFGVNRDTTVIAYDDNRFAYASRLWWLLRYFGHTEVYVLDGGYSGWRKQGLPISKEASVVQGEGNFKAQPQTGWTVDYKNICEQLENPRRLLIDSRETPRYQGLQEPIDPIAGHIPGAANFPWQEVTDEHGFARCPSHQKQRLSLLKEDKEIVVYCGSGVTACVNLLAMEMAGIHDAKLYPGSWSDWCSYET